jgi:hypothetical protein
MIEDITTSPQSRRLTGELNVEVMRVKYEKDYLTRIDKLGQDFLVEKSVSNFIDGIGKLAVQSIIMINMVDDYRACYTQLVGEALHDLALYLKLQNEVVATFNEVYSKYKRRFTEKMADRFNRYSLMINITQQTYEASPYRLSKVCR